MYDDASALELTAVTLHYDGGGALDAVTLALRPGQVVGLLGPNGAGKTTAVNLICGLMEPDDREVRLLGAPPAGHAGRAARARLGVVPQDSTLYPELDALEHLRLSAALHSLKRPAARIEDMLRWSTCGTDAMPAPLPSEGKAATGIFKLISTSDGFFLVQRTPEQAQKVAAVITIPPSFDADIYSGHAKVDVRINNVDLDFADDIRRSVSEAVVSYNVDAGKQLDAAEAAENGGKTSDVARGDENVILGSHYRTNPYGLSVQA